MRLTDFSGGVNTRLSPRRLANNMATVCVNVDFDSTDLKPAKNIANGPYNAALQGDGFYSFGSKVYSATSVGQADGGILLPYFMEVGDDLYRLNPDHFDGTYTLQRLLYPGLANETWVTAGFKKGYLYAYGNKSNNPVPSGVQEINDVTADYASKLNTTVQTNGTDIPEASDKVRALNLEYPLEEQYLKLLYVVPPGAGVQYKFSLYVKSATEYVSFSNIGGKLYRESYVNISYGLKIWVNNIIVTNPSANYDLFDPQVNGDWTTGVTIISTSTYNNPKVEEIIKHQYTYLVTLYSTYADFETTVFDDLYKTEAYEWDTITINVTRLQDFDLAYFDKVRIYRSGNGATIPTLIDERDTNVSLSFTGASYAFVDADLSDAPYLGITSVFNSLTAGQTPDNIIHGVEFGNRIILASKNKVYINDPGAQDSFPVVNVIKMNQQITGLAETSRGLLVFHRTKTYLITLAYNGRFSKQLISGDQGCVHARTIQTIGASALWFSEEGNCAFKGNRVIVVSKSHLGIVHEKPLASAYHNEKYYALLSNGAESRIYVLDLRYGRQVIYYLEIPRYLTNLENINGIFYGVYNDTLYEMYKGGDLEYIYQTGLLESSGLTVTKRYDNIYAFSLTDKPVLIEALNVFGESLGHVNHSGKGLIDFKLIAQRSDNYGIILKMVGSARLAEIEFKIEGRHNAR